jgi:UDP-N-acetylmuramate: L-alanyl-gamma-D-glutamyl-meso-diaminopimelate ligase
LKFGAHNLNNLAGAKWICQIYADEADFYEAIASFKGASKRLKKLPEVKQKWRKDFAHSQQSCNYKSRKNNILIEL